MICSSEIDVDDDIMFEYIAHIWQLTLSTLV